jgi:integrase/recombinase XerD
MRSLLRFLYLDGQITVPLAGAVPSAAAWQLAALPRAVSAADLARLTGSCDRRSAAGRRDFAILVLLARLGLRAGEAGALELGDISWRQGEITIRGKGSRRDSLPLPADAGEAVAVWLREGRPPDAACPAVSVWLRPPHGRLASASVSYVVRRACGRAGVTAAGAHRLWHAAATGMLAAGGTLAEIGQVLRHARPGQPISPYRLAERLHQIGIHPGPARSTALFQLATELPAAILARMLGIHIKVAVAWQHASAGDWMSYAADVSRRLQH